MTKTVNRFLTSAAFSLIGLCTLPAIASSEPVKVWVGNFAEVENSIQFERSLNTFMQGQLNTFGHMRAPIPLDKQNTIRMNRDTLYSNGLIDISKGATITVPDTNGRYMSIMIQNEQGYTNKVYHGGGTYSLTMDEFGTEYVGVVIRTLVNADDPEDIKKANQLQDAVKVEANSAKPYQAINYDQQSYQETFDALIALGRGLPGNVTMFGKKEDVDPTRFLIGTAYGFAGLSEKEAVYINVEPNLPVGEYQLDLKDVPVDGFWSISLYNKDGFFEENQYDAYSINNMTAVPNQDGSYTIRFGGDPTADNYLHIEDGWNYTGRLYLPHAEVLDGSWTFPNMTKQK